MNYWLELIFSAGIARFSLVLNSPAVIIGAVPFRRSWADRGDAYLGIPAIASRMKWTTNRYPRMTMGATAHRTDKTNSRVGVSAALPLVPTRPAWWQWLTVLSLDAPIVCLVWQSLLARIAGVGFSRAHGFVLGASVWLAYAADRWLEGWRLDKRHVRTQRHHFYQRRRWSVFAVWVGVFTADVAVALTSIDREHFVGGLLLLGAVLVYLLSHQLVHRHRRWRPPKEVVVALLLTAGVAFFLVPIRLSSAPLVPLAAFAVACFTNCALISSWEQDVDIAQGQTSLALQSARNGPMIKWLPWAATGLGLLAFALIAGSARIALACGAGSTLLLGLVDRLEPYIGWAAARVLADIALLTPFLPLLWGA